MDLNGTEYRPGTIWTGMMEADFGAAVPVSLICGAQEGKTLLLTAGIHSKEYVGIEALYRLVRMFETGKTETEGISTDKIHGRLIIIHSSNYSGFLAGSPDTVPEDGKNLNRVFPGKKDGSFSEKLADYLEEHFLTEADFHVDLHGGGVEEDLFPHVYCQGKADETVLAASRAMCRHVNVRYMGKAVKDTGGIYNRAGALGIPAILLERGGKSQWTGQEVEEDIDDILNVMRYLGILQDGAAVKEYDVQETDPLGFIYAKAGDLWHPARRPGSVLAKGDLIGTIESFSGQRMQELRADSKCVLLYQKSTLYAKNGDFLAAIGLL